MPKNTLQPCKQPWLIELHGASKPTFSSPDATLKTSSTTEPTARRAALDEWTSFQMVSLSTCQHTQTHTNTHEALYCLNNIFKRSQNMQLHTVFHLSIFCWLLTALEWGRSRKTEHIWNHLACVISQHQSYSLKVCLQRCKKGWKMYSLWGKQ